VDASAKVAYALDVQYSLVMIAAMTQFVGSTALPDRVPDACLEAYFTHYRVLVEFFVRPAQQRDIHATDWLSNWVADEVHGVNADDHQRLDRLWVVASQAVSHFSRARTLGPGEEPWDTSRVGLEGDAQRLIRVADAFCTWLTNTFDPSAPDDGTKRLLEAPKLARTRLKA
jgi:hypothetical protein